MIEEIYNYYSRNDDETPKEEIEEDGKASSYLVKEFRDTQDYCRELLVFKEESSFLETLERSEKDIIRIANLWRKKLMSHGYNTFKTNYYAD